MGMSKFVDDQGATWGKKSGAKGKREGNSKRGARTKSPRAKQADLPVGHTKV